MALSASQPAFANIILPAPSIMLAWDPSPTPNIGGYRLYQGVTSLSYTSVTDLGNVFTASVGGLTPGVTYYFAVTVYDTSGVESKLSAEVSYTVPVPTQPAPQPVLSMIMTHESQVLLIGSIVSGHTYSLAASDDSVTWNPIWTVVPDRYGTFQFVDPEPALRPRRFYRLQDLAK